MTAAHTYRTIHQPAEGSYSESGSKFLAFAFPVRDEQTVKHHRDLLRKAHHRAVHVVWAARIGYDEVIERSSDDGEPAGSAGKSVLYVLRAQQITNCAILVVRYFGGKKLGIPGLIHAYRTAAEDAVNHTPISVVPICEQLRITCSMANMQTVLHQLNKAGAQITDSNFEEICTFIIHVARERYEAFQTTLQDLWQAHTEHVGSID